MALTDKRTLAQPSRFVQSFKLILFSSIAVVAFSSSPAYARKAHVFPDTQALAASQVDLLAYLSLHVVEAVDPTQSSIPEYDRKAQFGTWAHQDTVVHCRDTRADVLVRDADPSEPVSFKTAQNCSVTGGLWQEPYTGNETRKAADLQIDHVVPLQNAYYSGAYSWRAARRCHYANYLGENFHLLAVSGHENMSKGDKAPDEYLPPRVEFQCSYVSAWMKIKTIWELSVTPDELDAIKNVIRKQNCDQKLLTISQSELNAQRQMSTEPIAQCERFEKEGYTAFLDSGRAE